METAHDLQIREETILARQEEEVQRTLEKTLRGKKKRYDRFGPITKNLLTPQSSPKEFGNKKNKDDDEMSMGLLLSNTKNGKGAKTDAATGSQTDTSYQTMSDTCSSKGSVSEEDHLRYRSYFIRDEVNF